MKAIICLYVLFSLNTYAQSIKLPSNGQLCLLQHALKMESESISKYFDVDSPNSFEVIINVNNYLLDFIKIPFDNALLLNSLFGTKDSLIVIDSLLIINQRLATFLDTTDIPRTELFLCSQCRSQKECYVLKYSPIICSMFSVELSVFEGNDWHFSESKKRLFYTFLIDEQGDLIGSVRMKR